MIYVFVGLVILTVVLYKFKTDMKKLTPGNIWEDVTGSKIEIVEILDPQESHMIVCMYLDTKEICYYDTNKEQKNDPTGIHKLKKYIGTKKSHPEYWL